MTTARVRGGALLEVGLIVLGLVVVTVVAGLAAEVGIGALAP